MNTLTKNAVKLTALSLSSLLLTFSVGATAANRKVTEVNAGSTVEMASPQGGYLISQVYFCTVNDPAPPLNVRSTPNGTKIGTLANNTKVTIVDTQRLNDKPWNYIIAANGTKGWVANASLNCDTVQGNQCELIDSDPSTNVRNSPNGSTVVGRITKQDQITATESNPDGTWRRIYSRKGVTGWVATKLLKCS